MFFNLLLTFYFKMFISIKAGIGAFIQYILILIDVSLIRIIIGNIQEIK